MANQLKVADVLAIRALVERGWSYRRIARELGVHRETVARYARTVPEPASALTGSNPPDEAVAADSADAAVPKPATSAHRVRAAPAPTRSNCEPHRELILQKLEEGLSARRIWQDLVAEHHVELGYYAVQRFVRRLGASAPVPFRRMECAPGAEAQLDFGRGAPVVSADGRRRRTWFFRIVLSHSRKGYTEAVFRQTTDDLIRCLENAFDAFGGVPQTLVFDNAKSAVLHPDWYDPELNPKLEAFCTHAGTVLLPTKPRTPRHKGKVENSVAYVKGNALKGRTFPSLEAQNAHLAQWEATVADTRIHGTTRRQVQAVFDSVERSALQPLPDERFPYFEEATRVVHRDGHVEVAKAYYELPPEYVGRTVWVRWDSRLVRVFDHRMQPIVVHVRQEPGRFSPSKQLHPHKVSAVERGAADLLQRTQRVGPHTHAWSSAMLDARGIAGVRVLVGLHALAKQHASNVLEDACAVAHSHGAYRLRAIRQLIKRRGAMQEQFEFMQTHRIIRTLDDYTAAAQRAIRGGSARSARPGASTRTTSPAGAGDQDRSTGRGPGPQASPQEGLGGRVTNTHLNTETIA